jgi:FkbM family methyltransferase
MIRDLVRFAYDSCHVLTSPQATKRKTMVLLNLVRPSQKMLGFNISSFHPSSLRLLYREIFARQYYYFQCDTDSPTIHDCGANLGMASLYFKWLYPKATIHAYEPDPETFALLQKNVDQNRLTGLTTHQCALWNENTTLDFFTKKDEPGSPSMSTRKSRLQESNVIQVPGKRLSEFIQGPTDFVKLDVEGAEHEVLADLISSRKIDLIKQLVVEYHHRIRDERSCMAKFLDQLERVGFEYQIHALLYPLRSSDPFQDILIRACRPALRAEAQVSRLGAA